MNDEWKKIEAALGNDKFQWRTLDGLATESGVPMRSVIAALDSHSDNVVRSSVPSESGKALYTLRAKYAANTSPFKRLLGATTMKILP